GRHSGSSLAAARTCARAFLRLTPGRTELGALYSDFAGIAGWKRAAPGRFSASHNLPRREVRLDATSDSRCRRRLRDRRAHCERGNPRPTSLATRGERGGGRGLAPSAPRTWLGLQPLVEVEHQPLDDVDRPGRRPKPPLELFRHPLLFVVRPRLEQLVGIVVVL